MTSTAETVTVVHQVPTGAEELASIDCPNQAIEFCGSDRSGTTGIGLLVELADPLCGLAPADQRPERAESAHDRPRNGKIAPPRLSGGPSRRATVTLRQSLETASRREFRRHRNAPNSCACCGYYDAAVPRRRANVLQRRQSRRVPPARATPERRRGPSANPGYRVTSSTGDRSRSNSTRSLVRQTSSLLCSHLTSKTEPTSSSLTGGWTERMENSLPPQPAFRRGVTAVGD
jgi:hypothetical protein